MPTRKPARARKSKSPRPVISSPPAPAIASWAVYFYLAGDLGSLGDSIRRDRDEIFEAGSSREVAIAVQYDGPEGCSRYVVPTRKAAFEPVEQLGRVDSGSAGVLADFLRWALLSCPAERIAVILGGLSALDPKRQDGDANQSRVFTICRDDLSGGYLDVVELGDVIRDVLAEQGRSQVELLATDTCHTQFLELAYELEGRVQVLMSSQTLVPGEGWDYTKVIQAWHQAAQAEGGKLDANALARVLVPSIIESYNAHVDKEPYCVSALDLRRLDDVARAFDTLCISTMQSLGEGLIWEARRVLTSLFDEDENGRDHPAYDCGSFFILLSAAMDAMADEAAQGWLGTTLQRASGPAFARFLTAVANHLKRNAGSSSDAERHATLVAACLAPDPVAQGKQLHRVIGEGIRLRMTQFAPGRSTPDERARTGRQARERDQALAAAIREAFSLLPLERQFDYERLQESIVTARQLAKQARQAAVMLLGDAAIPPEIADQRNPAITREGMVLAAACTAGSSEGWPRWSGVSLYRPPKLDELMNASYQDFAFHKRIHWAALLGAANLIQDHPRALWRLISSLLATGGAGTRRDLLRRLTGADSVVWGLRDQFRVMAPAPTLTLSLERRRGLPHEETPADPASPSRENYLLRLESANSGAVITEQLSRVQPNVMQRALDELDELLGAEYSTAESFKRLRAIGGLLGEDIFQVLGRTLVDEREAALADAGSTACHLQLQIPRELMRYPWELMHQRGEWLSERFAMGRQVFMETGLARRVPRRRQGRVRPLVVGDPVFDQGVGWEQLPGARAEAEQVAGWFERLREDLGDVIDFVRERDTRIHTRLTNAEFRALLREGNYDIVHFAGHGVFNAADPETSAWLLSDGELWALEIRNTLMEHSAPPWLVYANACESAMETGRPRYQGNVFGLASAFINQGVAAYIAPLWPIDDLLAQEIALDFYRQLLSERVTLGESLRRAKAAARATVMPTPAQEAAGEVVWAGLGWASLVLYGDATEELFQALAGSERRQRTEPVTVPAPTPPRGPAATEKTAATAAPRAFLHAPDRVLHEWVDDPAAVRTQRTGRRGAAPRGEPLAGPELELIEEAGLRRWRVPAGGGGGTRRGGLARGADGLPGSDLARLLADDRVRRQLPGRRGVIRVIGRWVVGGFKDGITGLVREYDREEVPQEGLMLVGERGVAPLTRENLPAPSTPGVGDRALLIVHGTFSKLASPVEGFGPEFLHWARKRYRAVIGFDHWTLSKTPLENAGMLAEQLRAVAPELLANHRLDVITHSRGGLVGRAFCELAGEAEAVQQLIFLGTPNCGTDLANPENWGAMADVLVNMTGLDYARIFGKLAGLLARLAVMGGEQKIPGLLAQNPLMAGVKGSFLHQLQATAPASSIRYAAIAAEFEPSPLLPNLKALWSAAKEAGIDTVVDKFFGHPNDLVVNTSHVWCIDQPPSDAASLPKFLDASRVLAFVPPHSTLSLPPGVQGEVALGVHHCNLFGNARVQEYIKRWLSESKV